jgi:hypothetical protein
LRRIATAITNMDDDQLIFQYAVINEIRIAGDREDANTRNIGLSPKSGVSREQFAG